MTSGVFISYARDDREIADRIAHDLTSSGVGVLYDRHLTPGDVWDAKLMDQIRDATHALVLLSPSYMRSPWARKELEAALLEESEGRTRIVPVLIRGTETPSALRTRHYADLRADYEAGLAQIREALTTKPVRGDISKARRSRWASQIVGVLVSLLGASASSISLKAVGGHDASTLAILGVLVAGATALIALLSAYRPWRRSRPVRIIAQQVERAYTDALELSALNPGATREDARE